MGVHSGQRGRAAFAALPHPQPLPAGRGDVTKAAREGRAGIKKSPIVADRAYEVLGEDA
jgi:hypothetical protein